MAFYDDPREQAWFDSLAQDVREAVHGLPVLPMGRPREKQPTPVHPEVIPLLRAIRAHALSCPSAQVGQNVTMGYGRLVEAGNELVRFRCDVCQDKFDISGALFPQDGVGVLWGSYRSGTLIGALTSGDLDYLIGGPLTRWERIIEPLAITADSELSEAIVLRYARLAPALSVLVRLEFPPNVWEAVRVRAAEHWFCTTWWKVVPNASVPFGYAREITQSGPCGLLRVLEISRYDREVLDD